MPEKIDSVTTGGFRVTIPGAAALDTQAVHLPGGIVAANPFDVIAQAVQQVRQVGIVGGVDLPVCIVPVRGTGLDLIHFLSSFVCCYAVSLTGAWMVLTPPLVQAEPHIP